ncbi:MAG: hypothetical protein WCO00_01310 [Rhodospirillaceae bacterium]
MSIAAVSGVTSQSSSLSQTQALQAKPAGIDPDHDGDNEATESASEKAGEAKKLSPPVDSNRGRSLDVVA